MSRRLDPDEPAAEVAGPPVGGIIGPPGFWPAGAGGGGGGRQLAGQRPEGVRWGEAEAGHWGSGRLGTWPREPRGRAEAAAAPGGGPWRRRAGAWSLDAA